MEHDVFCWKQDPPREISCSISVTMLFSVAGVVPCTRGNALTTRDRGFGQRGDEGTVSAVDSAMGEKESCVSFVTVGRERV